MVNTEESRSRKNDPQPVRQTHLHLLSTSNKDVEAPLVFGIFTLKRVMQLVAIPLPASEGAADIAVVFSALPRIPVTLLLWDAMPNEDFQAQVKQIL